MTPHDLKNRRARPDTLGKRGGTPPARFKNEAR